MQVPVSVAHAVRFTPGDCCPYCLNAPVDDSGCCPPDGACPCAGLHVNSPAARERALAWASGRKPWRPGWTG